MYGTLSSHPWVVNSSSVARVTEFVVSFGSWKSAQASGAFIASLTSMRLTMIPERPDCGVPQKPSWFPCFQPM